MATWKVIGEDADTGAPVAVDITAADEASALLAALQRGVYVTRVRRCTAPATTQAAAPVAQRPAPSPPKATRPDAPAPRLAGRPDAVRQ